MESFVFDLFQEGHYSYKCVTVRTRAVHEAWSVNNFNERIFRISKEVACSQLALLGARLHVSRLLENMFLCQQFISQCAFSCSSCS